MSKKINKSTLQDAAAERAVLAGLCQYGLDCYLDIDFITADHFNDEMNQILFNCIHKSISNNSKVGLDAALLGIILKVCPPVDVLSIIIL